MAKLEMVIRALECCGSIMNCEECPYNDKPVGCFTRLKSDALELLKEREAVKPIIETRWETLSVYDGDVEVTENKCGACGAEIDKWDKFCRVCGRAVKWE